MVFEKNAKSSYSYLVVRKKGSGTMSIHIPYKKIGSCERSYE